MIYGLIGYPLTHSFSEKVHKLLCPEVTYTLNELNGEEFISFFKNKDFQGVNVTIPYKKEALKYIDQLDDNAKNIKAINVVVNKQGVLFGYNTDCIGFEASLLKYNFNVKGSKCLILGSGGTALTVKEVLIKQQAKNIYLVSRNNKKGTITYKEAEAIYDIDYIFNTTPYGMWPNVEKECLLNLDKFPYLRGVGDVIFNPFCTSLLFEAQKREIKTFNGLYMLCAQAEESEKLFGNSITNSLDTTYKALLRSEGNIVLIGMPYAGKSTAAKNLSRILNMPFYDVDQEIETEEGQKINEIFQNKGETYFRNKEKEVINRLATQKGIIISTGGGSLLDEENVFSLKQRGNFVYLNRSLEILKKWASGKTRPLLKVKSIEEIYNERHKIYEKYADIIVHCVGSAEFTLSKILKEVI